MSLPSLDGTITLDTPKIIIDTNHVNVSADMAVTGDKSKPLSMMMVGDANQPLSMLVLGDKTKPLTMMMLGDANQPMSMLIKGDPNNPVAASIELVNLPRFTVADIQKLTSMRISLPGHHQMCFKVMGRELFSLCLSGEGQAITQPYVPNAYERCEVSCCDEDTTPFPTRDHVTTGGTVVVETGTPTK